MADALCGPSNALQQLSKHQSADRSLQRDRLAATGQPEESFRSSPDSRLGLLDHEFAAFQTGHLQPALSPLSPAESLGFYNHSRPAFFASPASASWANDFQRLQISDPVTPPLRYIAAGQSPALVSAQRWRQEFLLQEHAFATEMPTSGASTYASSTFVNGGNTYTALPSGAHDPIQWQLPGPMLDLQTQSNQDLAALGIEAAGAFNLSEDDAMDAAESPGSLEDMSIRSDIADAKQSSTENPTPRIGADTIPDRREVVSRDKDDDRRELAVTAGQLLDSVRNDRSQKFQKSSFLHLMQQIRDGQATVEGTDIVQVG